MPQYEVTIVRTGWGCRIIEIAADDEKEAAEEALDTAGNVEFSEHDASYEVSGVKKISTELDDKLEEAMASAEDGVLDDIVGDVMADKASSINNQGVEAQVRFLLSHYEYDKAYIYQLLKGGE